MTATQKNTLGLLFNKNISYDPTKYSFRINQHVDILKILILFSNIINANNQNSVELFRV